MLFCFLKALECAKCAGKIIRASTRETTKVKITTTETFYEYYGPKYFTEVQRCVGWAISSRRITVQKRVKN